MLNKDFGHQCWLKFFTTEWLCDFSILRYTLKTIIKASNIAYNATIKTTIIRRPFGGVTHFENQNPFVLDDSLQVETLMELNIHWHHQWWLPFATISSTILPPYKTIWLDCIIWCFIRFCEQTNWISFLQFILIIESQVRHHWL